MHQAVTTKPHVNTHVNDELTSYKDLVINYLIRSNSQVAHTLIHTKSTMATLEAFHLAGKERSKTRKRTAYQRSTLEDNTPAGVLLISAATAGFQGVEFGEWLTWARMLAKSGLSIEDQPLRTEALARNQQPEGTKIKEKSPSSPKTKEKPTSRHC
jgi:hypothetical protein